MTNPILKKGQKQARNWSDFGRIKIIMTLWKEYLSIPYHLFVCIQYLMSVLSLKWEIDLWGCMRHLSETHNVFFSIFTTFIITIVKNHLIYWILIIDTRCNNVKRCNIWCPHPISEPYVHCTSLMRPSTAPIFSFFPDRLYSRYLDIGQLE